MVKAIFNIGDKRQYWHIVTENKDTASFFGEEVHPVYATFAIARDAEWSSRLFVLEMKEAHEEGIGTFVEIKHIAPALVGEEVIFEAEIIELEKNKVNCSIVAKVADRIIATGKTGQKIIEKEKLKKYFESFR